MFTVLQVIIWSCLVTIGTTNITIIETEKICMFKSNCKYFPKFPRSENCGCHFTGLGICVDFLDSLTWSPTPFQLVQESVGFEDQFDVPLRFLTTYASCLTHKPVAKSQLIIQKCPDNYKDLEIKRQCEDGASSVAPIDYNGLFTITFNNFFCAKCHGIDENLLNTNFTVWSAELVCPNITYNKITDIQNGGIPCSYSFKQPEVPSVCFQSTVLNSLVNHHCPICENDRGNAGACTLCRMGILAGDDVSCEGNTDPGNDLTVLFRLPVESKQRIQLNGEIFKVSDVCQNDENYDKFLQKCRQFVCPVGRYPKLGRCHKNSTIYLPLEEQPFPIGTNVLSLKITTLKTYFNPEEESYLATTITTIIVKLKQKRNYIQPPSSVSWRKEVAELRIDIQQTLLEDFLDILSTTQLVIIKGVSVELELTNNLTTNNVTEICNQELYEWQCSDKATLDYQKETVFVKVANEPNSTLLVPLANSLFLIKIPKTELDLIKACFCSPRQLSDVMDLNCSSQVYKYTKGEFEIDLRGNLKILFSELVFEKEYFYLDESMTAFVCYQSSRHFLASFFKFDPIVSYLSWACSGISVIFLLVTVILFVVFKELRNLSSKITTCLAVVLIFGQISLHLPHIGLIACRALAAFTHWSWLSSFLWMTSQAVNMLVTFHPRTFHKSSAWHDEFVFRKYFMVCTGLPFLFVAVILLLDLIPGNHLHVNYGLVTCGWFSDFYGSIYVFFVPVGLFLLVNIICFSLTLFYIEKAINSSNAVTGKKRERYMCFIYLKITSAMGFSWIFGFVASFVDVSSLWYMYVILNGLQGFFIFLSFGVNVKTRSLIKSRISTFTGSFKSQKQKSVMSTLSH